LHGNRFFCPAGTRAGFSGCSSMSFYILWLCYNRRTAPDEGMISRKTRTHIVEQHSHRNSKRLAVAQHRPTLPLCCLVVPPHTRFKTLPTHYINLLIPHAPRWHILFSLSSPHSRPFCSHFVHILIDNHETTARRHHHHFSLE